MANTLFEGNYKELKTLHDGTLIIELDNPIDIQDLIRIIKTKLKIPYVKAIIKNNECKRIAIHGGEGFNYHHVNDAAKEGIDTYLAGDLTHHLAENAYFTKLIILI